MGAISVTGEEVVAALAAGYEPLARTDSHQVSTNRNLETFSGKLATTLAAMFSAVGSTGNLLQGFRDGTMSCFYKAGTSQPQPITGS